MMSNLTKIGANSVRILLGLLVAVGISAPAFAQTSSTRATLEAQNNAVIIPNGVGSITGAKLNGMLGNMIASTGTLLDQNVFSSLQTFSVSPVIPTLPANTSTTQAASTAFVINQIATTTPPLSPGSTVITPKTNGGVLFDNNGILGDSTTLPTGVSLSGAVGLPISTGVSGLGTGVAAGLANAVTGSGSPVLAVSPVLVTPALGTPSSGIGTNITGLPLNSGVTGLLPLTNGGANASLTASNGGVVYSTASALAVLGGDGDG